MPAPILIEGGSNRAFIEEYARPGRVGLVGGASLLDKLIVLAQKPIVRGARKARDHAARAAPDRRGFPEVPGAPAAGEAPSSTGERMSAESGAWSHAFLFQGRRADGEHWVIESDLEIHTKHIRLGVQENRASKFHDEKLCPRLAILDFGLDAETERRVLHTALDLVAARTRYSLRELLGTLVALPSARRRARPNPMARERAVCCSALVRYVFHAAGIDLAPGLDVKHTTPEDLSRSPRATATWILDPGGTPARRSRRKATRAPSSLRRRRDA